MKRFLTIFLLIIPFLIFSQNDKKEFNNKVNKIGNETKGPPLPCVSPDVQASAFTASAASSSSINLTWVRGNGDNVLILIHEAAVVDSDPESGNSYTASNSSPFGDEIGTGNFVVYKGNGTSTTVTGLIGSTTYHFSIYEFYDTDICFLIPGATANATTTASTPNVTSVTNDNFFKDKGATITIAGTDLSGASVDIAGISASSITSNTATQIVAIFNAGVYSNNTLIVTTGATLDTYTMSLQTRNVIPVGGGTDFHTTIQSALDGLSAWYTTTSFGVGDLSGTKTIDVYNGTYTEKVTPNVNLGTTSSESLIIQNHTGETPQIDASGLTNAFYVGALNYVTISGFTAYNSTDAVIYSEGDNNITKLNKCYGSSAGAGIILNNAPNSTLENNLVYDCHTFGIRLIASNNTIVKNNTIANNGNDAKGPPLPGVYTAAQLYVESGTGVSVTNNIIYAKTGSNIFTLLTESGITVTTNYNTYFKNGNTSLVYYNGTVYTDLAAWSGNGAGANEIETDPDFVNAGTDFHIKSVNGSYSFPNEWPPEVAAGAWNNDASTSTALDAGNPTDAFAIEPNGGGIINQGAYGNTAQASKSGAINWDGSKSTDWQDVANWNPEVIPTSVNDIIIPDACPNYPVVDDGTTTAEFNNMTIEANASVTIAVDGQMTASGTITNNRGVLGLIIKSDVTGDGSLILNNTGVSGRVERYLSKTNGETGQWHFIGSPITAAPVSLFNTNNFYEYDETNDDWWTGATYYGTSGWEVPLGNLTIGRGYAYYYNEATINFEGEINYSAIDLSISVGYTPHPGTGGNAANGDSYVNFDGWMIVSNPYPCVLDWTSMNSTNINNTLYFYDDLTSQYKYYNGIGGTQTDIGITVNGGTQFIPSGQGFFVKTDNSGGGIFSIPNSAKVHSSQFFWKAPKETPNNFIRLKVENSISYDETVLRTLPGAQTSFDGDFDAYKRFSWNSEVPQIFTYDNVDKIKYAINTTNINEASIVPLGYYFADTGEHVITVTEINFDDYDVYLVDKTTGTEVDLKANPNYTFTSDAGVFSDRLEIRFKKTIDDDFSSENINIYPNPASDKLTILGFNSVSNIKIYSVIGKLVKITIPNAINEINISSLKEGIYFIEIKSKEGKIVKKFVKN